MPDREILDFFDELCAKGSVHQASKGKLYYRARKIKPEDIWQKDDSQTNFYGHKKEDCLGPPPSKAIPGRANPKFISCLYLAEDEYTALAEVRPTRNEYISISEIRTIKDLKLFDFKYRSDSVNGSHYLKQILTWLSFSFSAPVNEEEDEIDYIPTQYLAEYIKLKGFDGLRYASSLAQNGVNVALFDETKVEAISSKVFQVQSVLYMAIQEVPADKERRLLPDNFREILTY